MAQLTPGEQNAVTDFLSLIVITIVAVAGFFLVHRLFFTDQTPKMKFVEYTTVERNDHEKKCIAAYTADFKIPEGKKLSYQQDEFGFSYVPNTDIILGLCHLKLCSVEKGWEKDHTMRSDIINCNWPSADHVPGFQLKTR